MYLLRRNSRHVGKRGAQVRDGAHLRHGQLVLQQRHNYYVSIHLSNIGALLRFSCFVLPVLVWQEGPVWPGRPPACAPSSWVGGESGNRRGRRSPTLWRRRGRPTWTWRGRGRCLRWWSRSFWCGSPKPPPPPPGGKGTAAQNGLRYPTVVTITCRSHKNRRDLTLSGLPLASFSWI